MKPGLASVAGAVLLACALSAQAYTVNISPRNPRTIYLQVGVGAFTGGTYNQGGSPAVNPTINVVSVAVPAAQVGNAPGFRLATAVQQAGFLQNRVVRMVVHMTGFGAMDELTFCR